jgi:hypothetical protein
MLFLSEQPFLLVTTSSLVILGATNMRWGKINKDPDYEVARMDNPQH